MSILTKIKRLSGFDNKQREIIKKDLTKAIGASGTQIFGGILYEEYNADLKGITGWRIYDKMRKNDAKVAASLKILSLPILNASWTWESASEDKNDLEAAEFLNEALFTNLKFEKFISEAIKYLVFGFYPFEKVFTVDQKGRIIWKSFEPRVPLSLHKWEMENGEPGITQLLSAIPKGEESMGSMRSIPANKLIHFVNDREGDNYEGISLLRPVYKHWFIKDKIYTLQAIGIERYLVGLPVIKLDNMKTGTPDYDNALELVKQMHSNERSGVVLDKEWDFDVLQSKGSGEKDMARFAIEHHDRMIAMNVLAPFLDLGQTGEGSFALSETQGSFFLLQLKQLADELAEPITDAGKELLILNKFNIEKYPKLKAKKIEKIDPAIMANALSGLIDGGMLDVDIRLKQHIRNIYDLPELSTEKMEEIEKEKEKEQEIINKNEILPKEKEIDQMKKQNPELTEEDIKAIFTYQNSEFTEYLTKL